MLDALYTIIIYPIYQIVEFTYMLFKAVFANTGIAIIGVSLAISLLCLPLYAVAEKWQEIERDTQRKMKYRVSRIKKAFKGDEQYMMLSAYYKVMRYRPSMALRSTFGLLIQIPFFIAAYNFLSHNSDLLGKSFLFIKDMGKPDAMFKIGTFSVNILPIAMTAINCIAGAIYTKGFELRDKIQVYGMALLFLVILYSSPSGLVFYWTMNNIFSLVKHIFYKLPDPLKIFHILISAFFTAAVVLLFAKGFKYAVLFLPIDLILICLPLEIKFCKYVFRKPFTPLLSDKNHTTSVFFISAIAFTLLCGTVIPSFLMTSSIAEYCYLDGYESPLYFLHNSLLQCIGLFLFWPSCIYFLFGKKVKASAAFLFTVILVSALANNFLFPGNYGTVLPEVIFTEHLSFKPSMKEFLQNTAVLLLIAGGLYALFYFNCKKIISLIGSAALISMIAISVINYSTIKSFYSSYKRPNQQVSDISKIINLSKKQKNVLVIMLDRSTGYIIDPVFNNNPELKKQFDGFTLYPNTISFGSWTIQGAVCLYGGYDYTPWQMNKRNNIPMVEKHNQGLSLQPRLFSENGYKVTVMDPPYPNYDTPPVFKAFEQLEDTSCYKTLGKYNSIWSSEHDVTLPPVRSRLIKRNFLWFSLFKVSPMIFRSAIHYEDFWNGIDGKRGEDTTHFVDNYAVLDYLPELTNLDNEKPCYVIMNNEICHDQVYTQFPNYEPASEITDIGSGKWNQNKEYHVNVAAYKKLGEYFDYLKANGVYDNTRIIIVADHGALTRMPQFDESPTNYPLEKFNPVLMVKDFNAHTGENLKIDNSFMTHADVPAIAFEDLITDPVNPWIGSPLHLLTTKEKNELAIVSMSDANGVKANVNNGYKIKDSDWYMVHDSIFDSSNWEHNHPSK